MILVSLIRKRFKLIVLVFLLVLFGASVFGQATITSAQSGSWSSASTWVGGIVPSTAAHDNVIIATGHTVTYSTGNSSGTAYGALSVIGTLINNGTLHANSVIGTGNIISTLSSGVAYLQTGYSNTDFTFSGAIGPGPLQITKGGTGIFTLSGNNSFTANISISAGYIRATNPNSLGSTSGSTNTTTGAGLIIDGGITIYEPLSLSGSGPNATGCVRSVNGTNTLAGDITSTGSISMSADVGAGLIITSSFTSGSVGNLTLIASDVTSSVSVSCPFSRTNTITLDGAGEGVYSGVVGGAALVTKNGTGTWTLSGNNSYSGATTVTKGVLKAGIANNAFGANSAVTLSNSISASDAILDLNNFNQSVGSIYCSNNGTISLGTGNLTFGTNNTTTSSFTGIITGSGNIIKVGTGSAKLSGASTFTGTTTISAGTLNIGSNAPANSPGALGNSDADIILGDANTAINNSSPTLSIVSSSITIGRKIVIADFSSSGTYSLTSSATNNNFSGQITLNQPLTISGGSTSQTLLISGSIVSGNSTEKNIIFSATNASCIISVSASISESSGVLNLVSQSTGGLVLSGNNSFSGTVSILSGYLSAQSNNALGSTSNGTNISDGAELRLQGNIIIPSEPLQISGSGLSTTGAIRNTSGANSFNGPIVLNGNARINADAGTLTIPVASSITGLNFDLTIGGASTANGIICNGLISIGVGNIYKDGAGTLTIGQAPSMTGNMTVSAGVLKSGASLSFPSKMIISGGKFDCNTFNSSVYSLTLGSTLQLANSYGSTSSAATIKNNTYFVTTSGVVNAIHADCRGGTIAYAQTICAGATPVAFTSSVVGTGANGSSLAYKWQYSNTGLFNSYADINLETSLTYSPGALNADTWYRRVLNSTIGADICTDYSNAVKISVIPIPSSGTIGSNQTIFYGQIPTSLTSLSDGVGVATISYTWENKTTGSWSVIGSASASTYSPGALTENTQFRRITNSTVNGVTCSSSVSNNVTVDLKYPQYIGGDGRGDIMSLSPETGIISGNQTVCYNASATINSDIGASPIKDATISYRWESSVSPYTTWTTIAGEVSSSLSLSGLVVTKKYRRITIAITASQSIESIPTQPVTITVYPLFSIGSISTNQTICYNTIPSTINGVAPTGSTGVYTYQWERYNSNTSSWDQLPSETNLNLAFTTGLQTTSKYRLKQLSNSLCGNVYGYTNEVTITVYDNFSPGNIQTTGQSICVGTDPDPITNLTAALGGDNNIFYQWQSKSIGGVFSDISGATSASYDPPASVTTTTIFRRLAKDGTCNAYTASVGESIITISPLLPASVSIVSDASLNTICEGTTVLFTATPTNGGTAPVYQWKLNGNNVGTNSPSYSSNSLVDGDVVTVEMTSNASPCLTGSPTTSNSITVTVNYITTITSQPVSSNICYGDAVPVLSVTARLSAPISYQWYSNTSLSNIGGTPIAGETSASYQVPSSISTNPGYYFYYVVVGGACQTIASNPVSVNSFPAFSISLGNSGPINICNNTSTNLSVSANGSTGIYTYQWYSNTINSVSGGTIIPGATSATYTVPGTSTVGDRFYYVIVTSTPCSQQTSSIIKVTTSSSLSVNTDPLSQVVCNNVSAILSGTAIGGSSVYTYSWFTNSINSNIGGTVISGASSNSYSVPATQTPGTRFYYLVISDATDALCGVVRTNVATIETRASLQISSNPFISQVICNNTSASVSVIVSGGSGSYSYQWYANNTNSNIGGTAIVGANNSTYTTIPTTTAGSNYYYVVVSDQICSESVSSAVSEVITRLPLSAGTQPSSLQSICNNSSVTISTAGAGSANAYKYQWYLNASNSTIGGAIIANATSSSYVVPPTPVNGSRYYYAVITDTICSESVSTNISEIYTYSSLHISQQPVDSINICNNTSSSISVLVTGGSGSYTYQWYQSLSNSNVGGTLLIGETASVFTIPATTNAGNYYYYVLISDAITGNCTIVSSVSTAHFYSSIGVSINPQSQTTVCNNSSASLFVSGLGANSQFTYQWYSNTANSNSGGSLISGATSATYVVPATRVSGYRYFYVVIGNLLCSESIATAVATVITRDSLSIQTQPLNSVSVCNNTNTQLFVSGVGGSGTYSYQWYQNIMNTNVGGLAIPGATSAIYTVPATITQGDRYYYAIISDNLCAESKVSNIATISTLSDFRIVSQPFNFQFVCNNSSTILTVEKAGGSNQISYQWYINGTNSNNGGVAIMGATAATYNVPGTTVQGDRYFYVKITDLNCGILTSNVAIVSTRSLPEFVVNPASVSQVCNNTSQLLFSIAVGGSGSLQYQWYSNSSNSSIGGSLIVGATSSSYTVPATQTAGDRFYYVVVTDASCSVSVTSTVAKVSTRDNLIITTQPFATQTICNNSTVMLSTAVNGGSGVYAYQWYYSIVNSTQGGQAISGATSSTYIVPSVQIQGSRYFYAVVNDIVCGTSVISNLAQVSIIPSIQIQSQTNTSQLVCINSTTTVGVTVTGGSSSISYQWYSSNNASTIGSTLIPGANTNQYLVPASGLSGNRYFYVVISDITCNSQLISSIYTVSTISAVSISVNPIASQTICNNTSASLSVVANGGTGTLNYQWYFNTVNSTIGSSILSGANTANFTVPPTTTAGDRYYYVVITDSGCGTTAISTLSKIITLESLTMVPVSNRIFCNGELMSPISFTSNYLLAQYTWTNSNTAIGLPASGSGNIQGYSFTNSSLNSVTANITVTPHYNNCDGSPYSFTITVHSTPTVSTILDQSLCAGSLTQPINFNASIAGSTFEWRNSNPSIGLPSTGIGAIPSFTVLNNSGAISQSQISVKPTSPSGCSGTYTLVTTIKVTPGIQDLSIDSYPLNVCQGDSVNALVANIPMGGNGVFSYQWQYSNDNSSYSNVPSNSAIARRLTAPPQTTLKWYRVIANSAACSATSTPVKIQVKNKPVITLTHNGLNSVSIGNTYFVKATGAVSYLWSPSAFVLDPISANAFLRPTADTRFIVKGTDAEGCSDTASISIRVLYLSLIYPNNILTPNNDGFNDTWKIKNLEFYPENQIQLFNSNGILIKEFSNYQGNWDGTINGNKLPTATYYFVIKLVRDNTTIKGFLNIAN